MKGVATNLLGLALLCSALSAQDTVHKTIRDLHTGCGAWSRMMALSKTSSAPATQKDVADAIDGNATMGYISGFMEATAIEGTPDSDLPKTAGDAVDAVCKYIDLHPEIWKLSRPQGLKIVVRALYAETK
jgi:hypothetical protein